MVYEVKTRLEIYVCGEIYEFNQKTSYTSVVPCRFEQKINDAT